MSSKRVGFGMRAEPTTIMVITMTPEKRRSRFKLLLNRIDKLSKLGDHFDETEEVAGLQAIDEALIKWEREAAKLQDEFADVAGFGRRGWRQLFSNLWRG